MTTPYNWKAAAAQATAPDEAIEKAFMDQAYVMVSQKAGPLMQPPYRLGFEIITKNDEATRMLGIFAFRIGKELIYAPVFFLNGDIKGTDLLYRHKARRMTVLNEKVVKKLISAHNSSDGHGVAKDMGRRQPQAMRLERIAFPPPTFKRASFAEACAMFDVADQAGLDNAKRAFVSALCEKREIRGGVLEKFIDEVGGVGAIEKLAGIITRVPKFAAAASTLLPRSVLFPAQRPAIDVLVEDLHKRANEYQRSTPISIESIHRLAADALASRSMDTKSASAYADLVAPELIFRQGAAIFRKGASEEAIKGAAERGYEIEDARKGLKPAIINSDSDFKQSISAPGVYRVLDDNGKKVEVFIGYANSLIPLPSGSSGYGCMPCSSSWAEDGMAPPRLVAYSKSDNSKQSQVIHKLLIAEPVVDKDYKDYTDEKPKAGKHYVLYDTEAGNFSEAFKCEDISKDSKGRYIVSFHRQWDYAAEMQTFIFNPDARQTRDDVFGGNIRFLRLATKKPDEKAPTSRQFEVETFAVSSAEDFDTAVKAAGYRPVTLRAEAGAPFAFQLITKRPGKLVSRVKMACHLARDLIIPATQVEEILDLAKIQGKVTFAVATTEKHAGAIRVLDEPEFRVESDPEFGVDTTGPHQWALRTSQFNEPFPIDRIGDHANLQPEKPKNMESLPEEVLETADADQIAQLSAGLDTPHTFEHGALASLASAYDSMSMVAGYVEKIEEAIDVLGRTLFLYYWKPEDFEKAYGEDDMLSLEQQLISQLKSLADIWIKLDQRTSERDPLSSPLPL